MSPTVEVREVHHFYPAGPEPGFAMLLELIPGLFLQTFGIGVIYAGSLLTGISLMLAYWLLAAINFMLCFVAIGFVTWPLTWIGFMIFCPIIASHAAKKRQQQAMAGRVTTYPATANR
ncbi:hypothetical protein [Luteolibacter pohnpeiensis]|uniref:hypothetical protein n=1 Tax=Luteolibacter pohnpeiensis TaxID=454153 RepID=UPI001902F9C5|nr:hypothetical protein [Luteolibacter pohnpeiensis]